MGTCVARLWVAGEVAGRYQSSIRVVLNCVPARRRRNELRHAKPPKSLNARWTVCAVIAHAPCARIMR